MIRNAEAQPVASWPDDGPPRSRRHGDVYFSAHDALGEARAVFLAGCGLPDAWRGRRRFVVGELGLGAGRNLAALMALWRQTREPGARLCIFSIENDLLTAAEVARALERVAFGPDRPGASPRAQDLEDRARAPWPELGEEAARLAALWPPRARGFHRIDLEDWGVTLDIALMEAADALRAWDGAADAWFLDGFSPAKDPQSWREEVLSLLAERSAPGARLATYTVAGAVRRGLAAAGFAVAKAPGHGAKSQRLEVAAPGERPPSQSPAPRIAILGAGIAGASLARALRAAGVEPWVIEAQGAGAGASGAPVVLAAPRLDAGLGPIAALFAQAARRAADLYDATPGAVVARGGAHLSVSDKDPRRFAAIAASDLFAPGAARDGPASDLVPGQAGRALTLADARSLIPATVLKAWLGEVRPGRAARLTRTIEGWSVEDASGETLARVDAVILATGAQTGDLLSDLLPDLWAKTPLQAVRGQAEWAAGEPGDCAPPLPVNFGAWLTPAPGGIAFGATHDRDDPACDLRPADRARNLDALAARFPDLARRLATSPLTSWAATRAASPDYLPLAGEAAPGLFVLVGLGGRGFTLAPLLAEHLAATLLGAPSPLPRDLAALVEPTRFARRAARHLDRRSGAREAP
ncbi:MAG: tRNA (5-methylaminomethyl-2-thiouridine)(34)-methyltransferase MnmD [Alphaproteobacteria bacterium]|nr:tRNA (5-methylaminomethyl-2-thiouridine)(34)-methyltransferase MnmD [Alphaproteobacteria bacterium]